jgi:hypothetical protein
MLVKSGLCTFHLFFIAMKTTNKIAATNDTRSTTIARSTLNVLELKLFTALGTLAQLNRWPTRP